MKNYAWILLTGGLVSFAFASGACGGGGGDTGGAGGTAPTTSSSTTTTTSSSVATTASTGSGSGGSCAESGWFADACETCMTGSCCQEIIDCQGETDCSDCVTGDGDPTACQSNTLFVALATCFQGPCSDACIPKSACNPVTNEGCNSGAGEACDLANQDGSSVFVCFPAPNETALCDTCSNASGPFCKAGTHCNEDASGGKCTAYCCTDADCGTGKCDLTLMPNGVGICVGANAEIASCDSPAAPPSGGSCYTP